MIRLTGILKTILKENESAELSKNAKYNLQSIIRGGGIERDKMDDHTYTAVSDLRKVKTYGELKSWFNDPIVRQGLTSEVIYDKDMLLAVRNNDFDAFLATVEEEPFF
jgi:hypothetical protein